MAGKGTLSDGREFRIKVGIGGGITGRKILGGGPGGGPGGKRLGIPGGACDKKGARGMAIKCDAGLAITTGAFPELLSFNTVAFLSELTVTFAGWPTKGLSWTLYKS